MSFENISKQLGEIATALRGVRVQVILLALRDTKQKHPRVVILENRLVFLLQQTSRNNPALDEVLEELECMVNIKTEHHQKAQEFASNRSS